MTVRELREALALARFTDEDAQVVIGTDPGEWVHPTHATETAVNLGRVVERVFFIVAPELPVEAVEDCAECARLRDVIDDARRELDAA